MIWNQRHHLLRNNETNQENTILSITRAQTLGAVGNSYLILL